ncbi:MAG: hypothetical protein AMJ88_13695 [Anaerolineae bacterium SM23_ 63]|nr:MAG: hypothetical protein AMJ88_13695 [Anaerolineae bacterium SM23_ 63]
MSSKNGNASQSEVITPSAEEKRLEARRTRYLVRTGYTVDNAAVLLGIRPKQVRRNIRRGNLEAKKVGVPYFISRANMKSFQRARAS